MTIDIKKFANTDNLKKDNFLSRVRIFCHVWPSYEQAVSDLDRSMHISLRVQVAQQLVHKRVARD
jgi:hypothetical protein